MVSFYETLEFCVHTCIYAGCGIHFGVPREWDGWRKIDHKAIYCPNGHVQYYTGKTKEQKLREQLKVSRKEHNQCVVRLTETIEEKDNQINFLSRSRASYKGKVARLKAKFSPESQVDGNSDVTNNNFEEVDDQD